MTTTEQIIRSCRVPESIPSGQFGLWKIERVADPVRAKPYVQMTILSRMTMATLNKPHGEVVMEDSPPEICRHLPILLAARGTVLVSGLGLGCVVRGLLCKPEVEHVDVVELDRQIINAIGPSFASNPRVTIHHGDAEEIEWPEDKRWDFAWHDVWSEHETLAIVHARLMLRYKKLCGQQGAWMLPRWCKRLMKNTRIL